MLWGSLALLCAAVGSVTSMSVVLAGGHEGGVYLTVNVTLALIGAALIGVGLRRRTRAARAARLQISHR